jgi:Trk-type K+ transport system membrane component
MSWAGIVGIIIFFVIIFSVEPLMKKVDFYKKSFSKTKSTNQLIKQYCFGTLLFVCVVTFLFIIADTLGLVSLILSFFR